MAQFPDETERPLPSIQLYMRPAGRTRCVLLAIYHLLLLVFLFVLAADYLLDIKRECVLHEMVSPAFLTSCLPHRFLCTRFDLSISGMQEVRKAGKSAYWIILAAD